MSFAITFALLAIAGALIAIGAQLSRIADALWRDR